MVFIHMMGTLKGLLFCRMQASRVLAPVVGMWSLLGFMTGFVLAPLSTYLWGVRTWHVLQHQADPCFGVMHWREFMHGVAVLTAVPAEPRKMFPLEDFTEIMRSLDHASLRDANLGLLMLVLLFTFSRTECPCPKTFAGFDLGKHWAVADFRLESQNGRWVLWVRFKAIKQDPRKERPSVGGTAAAPFVDDTTGHGHDWVPIGDLPDIRSTDCCQHNLNQQERFGTSSVQARV